VVGNELAEGTVRHNATLGLELGVLFASEASETPLLGHDDLLAAGELVLGTTERLHHVIGGGVLGANGEDDLANLHTSNETSRLTECTTHSGLQAISTCARKHLIDAKDVVWVNADAHVERVLATKLGDVLVARDAASLKSLRRQLLVLDRDQVSAEGELVSGGTLAAKVKDADLCVGDTTAIAGLDVGLTLAIAVATCRTATHV